MLESLFSKAALQTCNFSVNIVKSFRNSFFHKTPPVAASEKFLNFPSVVEA